MHIALICTDKPGSLQLRLDTRPEHLDHMKTYENAGKVAAGGPLLGEDGKPNGSLIVLDVADMAEARAIAAADPYAKAGLFANVEFRQWNWAINPPATRGS
jgi:uncharacterized protein YciI